jgi:hypothetical protein
LKARSYGALSAESVALIAQCTECAAVWLAKDQDRWVAYLTNDEAAELAFFCPDCPERGVQELGRLVLLLAPHSDPKHERDADQCAERATEEAVADEVRAE